MNLNKYLNSIHNGILSLNSNKYFTGIMVLLLNVGSKYVNVQLTENQQKYLKTNLFRQILIFTILWVATKDIYVSFMLTASFIILSEYILNENSRVCILPEYMKKIKNEIDINNDNIISDREIQRAIRIIQNANKN